MSETKSTTSARRLLLMIKLAVVIAVLAVIAVAVFYTGDLKAWIVVGLDWLREMGPVPFFCGLAFLPAFGFPVSPFTFTVGPAFTPVLGLTWVIVLTVLAIGINLALSYWLARYALRPVLFALMTRLGYKLPAVADGGYTGLTVLVRVTPGPPLFVQNYLLGLVKVPFRTYMVISWPIMTGWALVAILAGKALAGGFGKAAFFAGILFVIMFFAVRWLRRRYAKNKAVEPGAAVASVETPPVETP